MLAEWIRFRLPLIQTTDSFRMLQAGSFEQMLYVRKEFCWTLKVEPAYSHSLPMLINIHLQRAEQSCFLAYYNSVCLCPHSALPHSSYPHQEMEFRTLYLERAQGHFPHPQNILLMVDAGNLGSQSRMYQWINCLIRIPINCQAINENIWWFWWS